MAELLASEVPRWNDHSDGHFAIFLPPTETNQSKKKISQATKPDRAPPSKAQTLVTKFVMLQLDQKCKRAFTNALEGTCKGLKILTMKRRPKVLEELAGTTRVSLKTQRLEEHVNLAPCIVFGRNSPVSILSPKGRLTAQAVLVESNWMHAIDFNCGAADVIYFEPKANFEMSGYGAQLISDAALRVLEAEVDHWSSDGAEALLDVMGILNSPTNSAINCLKSHITSDPMARLSETEACAMVKLERTTMLRQFKQQTGMTFRAYKNWVALKHASRLIVGGEKFGIAGLDAGFADGAHFSRQFRATFGMTPTQALASLVSA